MPLAHESGYCIICEKGFARIQTLTRHVEAIHSKMSESDKAYVIDICSKYSVETLKNKASDFRKNLETDYDAKTVFQYGFCKTHKRDKYNLQRHFTTIHKIAPEVVLEVLKANTSVQKNTSVESPQIALERFCSEREITFENSSYSSRTKPTTKKVQPRRKRTYVIFFKYPQNDKIKKVSHPKVIEKQYLQRLLPKAF